jgi:hypothetical protein
MKNFLIVLLMMSLFVVFSVSCGEGVPGPAGDDTLTDDDSVTDQDEIPDEEEEIVDDVEIIDEGPVEEPDETQVEEPDEEVPFEKIGDFNLNFDGQINTDLSNYMSIRGGKGEVNFNYKMTPYTFGELTVIIVQLFPLAILQQGNVAVMWLDSAPGLGAEVKQVFGFTFPSTIQPGQQNMEAAQAFAFYGDIDVNVQAGQFDIRCVRAASYQGDLNVISYDGNNANFNASGDLLDPAAAGSQLPYPVCPE